MQRRWFIILLIVCSSCNTATFSEKDKERVSDEVRRTLQNYLDDVRSSGLLAELNYLDTSRDFFWVPPGYSGPISRDSVKAILGKSAGQFKVIDNRFENLRINPLSEELATYTATIRSNMTEVNGKKHSFTLLETGLMVRRKNGWKLHTGHTSALNEP